MDIQKLVLATTPYQARLALIIINTPYREAKLYGMTEKNPTTWVKLMGQTVDLKLVRQFVPAFPKH
jgi:hypothetical protein